MGQADPPQDGWRRQAREAMFQATIREAEQRYGTDNPIFNYRWEHVLAVHTLALKLARLLDADLDVIEAAAWLHDIRKDAGEAHPEEGAVFARHFLAQTDFPGHKIERVARVIEDHQGLWRDEPLQSLESQIFWDADKLSKLGLTAAFHWLGMVLAKNNTPDLANLIANVRDADWQEKTVASMHSEPARGAAEERLASFNELWEKLQAELEGEDLEIGD